MSEALARLRMFAGPNGSGKSRLTSVVRPDILGSYINADEIEAEMRKRGIFDFAHYGVTTTSAEISGFFDASTLLRRTSLQTTVTLNEGTRLAIPSLSETERYASYYAAVIADFVRQKLLAAHRSFRKVTKPFYLSTLSLQGR